jgi:eukaryotic-like serine/threonine-protein kinase
MSTRLIQQAEPIPGYRLVERLGRGGFGEVWKVVAPGGVFKAIKFVNGDMDDAGDDASAAEQELKALNRVKTIRHPYILSIDRFDIVDGQLMIVMEMADRSLWDRFEECRAHGLPGIPREELMRYMDEACEALDLMNVKHQIQHLDIKPQNLLLIHNHIKVADFGLAKDFEGLRGVVTGGITPLYAAPETSEGWISRSCDQYSLAIVYQELLTGLRPFPGTNVAQLLIQHLTVPPNVTPLPIKEREIVARALSKKPDQRYASCAEFVSYLRHCESFSTEFSRPQSSSDASAQTPRQARPEPAAAKSPFSVIRSSNASAADSQIATPHGVLASRTQPSNPASAPDALPRPAGAARERTFQNVSASESEKGILFPVYVVGAGMLGLRVMQCLRSRLHKRLNQETFPHWRWLFIDTDEATIDSSLSGPLWQSFAPGEVYHARMDRPLQYLKRDGLPPPKGWMGNDMLYRIPRLPATAGIRCFGRLALLDHAPALAQRMRKDLEAILADAAIDDAAQRTGLEIRSRSPRVYVAASLGGGTGSGMLIDLAYLLRSEMQQAGIDNPHLTGFLLAPTVDNRPQGTHGVANSFAALAELNHWSLGANAYEARFDMRQPARLDAHRPFDRCVLLDMPNNGDECPPAADRAADFLLLETLTAVGRRVDQARNEFRARRPTDGMSLQSCGSYRIVWPRRRLLETISYRFASKNVKNWISDEGSPARQEVCDWFETSWRKCELQPPALIAKLRKSVVATLRATPEALIEVELNSITSAGDRPDPIALAGVIDRIAAFVGKAGVDEETTPGKIADIFRTATEPLSAEAECEFATIAAGFVRGPACRFAAAEEVIRIFAERLQSQIDDCDLRCEQLRTELEEGFPKIFAALAAISHLVAKRVAQGLANIRAQVQEWTRKRLDYLTNRCVIAIYRQMLSNAPESLRAAGHCRQQLADWASRLERESEIIAVSSTGNDQLILPSGCTTLLEAADFFIEQIADDNPLDFVAALQQHSVQECQTLVAIGRAVNDNGLALMKALVAQARSMMEPRLGRNTPAAELLRERPDPKVLRRDLSEAFDRSKPADFGLPPAAGDQSFLLAITADEPGCRIKALAKSLFPDQPLLESQCAEEIVFYREYHGLSLTDLPQVGPSAQQAVYELRSKQRINPFSRNDVNWNSFLPE